MDTIGKILGNKGVNSPLLRGALAALSVEAANDVLLEMFGERSVNSARALYVKKQILSIACLSSIMAQEIRLREKQIISGINKRLGRTTVEKIRYLA